ncbi:MAG: GAF domain-containing protein [Geobacter sp.]|nr:GAF domain-containing protein [Geobacter sp.]
MLTLSQIIAEGESLLVKRIVMYAEQIGYINFTPASPDVWIKSIQGLSAGLINALSESADIPELAPSCESVNDRITAFGVEQARAHRNRGITLEMFLGLMKYFRQSYHDLIDGSTLDSSLCRWAHIYVERYFDRIELGFISEWERAALELKKQHEELLLDHNRDLLAANSKLEQEIAEKKRAEQQIQKLNRELERRVAARTLQLQRINEQNHHKLRELALLNRLSTINLSQIRLNRLTHLLLVSLVTPGFFDRAMLLMLNERSETLQGMLGIDEPFHYLHDNVDISDAEIERMASSDFSRRLRSCRIALVKGRDPFYRTVAEKKVLLQKEPMQIESSSESFLTTMGIKSFVSIPLIFKDSLFGIIIADNNRSGRRTGRDDMKFLQLFANHAGIAIENLMLCQNLEEANCRLHEAQEQLLHGERLATIGEMAAGIAHELKGPLVAIGGFARRLDGKITDGTPEKGYISTIIEEEKRLENLLDDVLSFSRKTTICYDRCTIVDLIDSSLSIVGHACQKIGVEVSRHYPRKQLTLYADCQQLKQVFINIFYNALEAMKGGGVLKISVSLSSKDRMILIKIADSGEGIPKNQQNSIFNPFFTTKKNGTGLGLPIANRIMINHGGKIKVRNHQGGGAEFTLLLPYHE